MKIEKRDKSIEKYDKNKIKNAIKKAFISCGTTISNEDLNNVVTLIESNIKENTNVEVIQDNVEYALMTKGYLKEAKAYILYRVKREELRKVINEFKLYFDDKNLVDILHDISKKYNIEEYKLEYLLVKFKSFYKENLDFIQRLDLLIKSSCELISKDYPKWEFIASMFLSYKIHIVTKEYEKENNINDFYEKILYLTEIGIYSKDILSKYKKDEILELAKLIDDKRDFLFTYSGLELLEKRYLIRSYQHELIETPQEMYLGISMHIMINEKDRYNCVKNLYDALSTLKITMATPTLSNARKVFNQMSSCFIDTVGDSLKQIYKSLDNFAQVSKHGGGMGLYFGKVRANGSMIRGYKNAAGGVIRWIRLVNDTAIAVDQLGVRQGACAVYLDLFHKDIPEFLQLKTNNGDDRMKAHDIFPAICYPNLFYKMIKEDINQNWYMFCPHEIYKIKGYHLEDYFDIEFERRYFDCVNDHRISRRVLKVSDVLRLIIKSLVETGTPFTFNRDIVNKYNPNSHKGIIYCSNLCTEICQNMKEIEIEQEEILVGDEKVVIQKTKPGDFVVCNLASLTLPNINLEDQNELKNVIDITVRALDNVIDLNYYPVSYAKITNEEYRAIGLGTSGYHHMLVKHGISFESEKHLEFVDKLYEDINYYAITASMNLAIEKGKYKYFDGSDFNTKKYFEKRNYNSKRWNDLKEKVAKNGLRNGYLLAIAPTSSTSIISGTTAAVDPILKKYFLEEKKGQMITRVAPDLDSKTFWLYKNAHLIDQEYVVRSAGIRGRHIDQAQSVNLYITNDYTYRKILNLYLLAYECEVKTIYYVRSKSLEIEECESCSS